MSKVILLDKESGITTITLNRPQLNLLDPELTLDLETAIDYSINAFSSCFATEEPKKAMSAFLDKKPISFRERYLRLE